MTGKEVVTRREDECGVARVKDLGYAICWQGRQLTNPTGNRLHYVGTIVTRESAVWPLLVDSLVTTQMVETGGSSTFVVSAGARTTPVVFVSGLGDSTLTWVPIIPSLTHDAVVVAYDRLGVGASAPTNRSRTIDDLADELNVLLSGLGLSPAVLVGHSLDGLIATHFARRRRDASPESAVPPIALASPAWERDLRGRGRGAAPIEAHASSQVMGNVTSPSARGRGAPAEMAHDRSRTYRFAQEGASLDRRMSGGSSGNEARTVAPRPGAECTSK